MPRRPWFLYAFACSIAALLYGGRANQMRVDHGMLRCEYGAGGQSPVGGCDASGEQRLMSGVTTFKSNL